MPLLTRTVLALFFFRTSLLISGFDIGFLYKYYIFSCGTRQRGIQALLQTKPKCFGRIVFWGLVKSVEGEGSVSWYKEGFLECLWGLIRQRNGLDLS